MPATPATTPVAASEGARAGAPAPHSADPAALAAIQARAVRVLFVGQLCGSAGISVAVTVGGPIVKTLLGADTFAGSASACVTLGGAIAGLTLSELMRRRGRRPGMVLGYAIALLGGIVTIVGAQARSLAPFLGGLLLFGVGQGTNLLARYAAADCSTPERRSRDISLLLFGSTFGAVLAQVLVGPMGTVAERLHLWRLVGPFLLSIVLLLVAIANAYFRLRPDPLVLAGGIDPHARGLRLPPVRVALAEVGRHPRARLALTSMVISQSAMVAVMTMTPIHMRDHGHSTTLSGYVIALHVVGMFGFAPLVGMASDRFGRLPVLRVGGGLLLLATLVSALAGPRPGLLFLGLFLLGLAWSCGMVAGTTLLSETVDPALRVSVQGSGDLLMSVCGGLAGFGSGFVKRALGYHMLSNIGALAAIALILATVSLMRADAAHRAVTAPVAP